MTADLTSMISKIARRVRGLVIHRDPGAFIALPAYPFQVVARILGVTILAMLGSALVSCAGPSQNQPSPTYVTSIPSPLPSATNSPTRVPTPTRTMTPTPIPTLEPLAVPTPPPGAQLFTFTSDPNQTSWFGSKEGRSPLGDHKLLSGISGGQVFVSVVQFDLQSLAPNSQVLFAALEITGRDASNLGTTGEWSVDLIDSGIMKGGDIGFDTVAKPAPLANLAHFEARTIAAGLTKRIIFSSAQLPLIQQQLETGGVTVRLSGPSAGGDNIFVWETGPGRGEPTLYLLAVPAPFVVITNTPTPGDVFAAATLVAAQTRQARDFGTPTPMPRSFVTATPSQGSAGYIVITSVPTPVNPPARTATALYATAVAATTGTFTPIPANWVTRTPLPLLIPLEQLTPVPTPTPTIAQPSVIELARRSIPPGLYNKIAFLEGPRENPRIWVMDPDGTHVALLTDDQVFAIAKARDAISPDGTKYVYQASDLNGQMQLWSQDLNFPLALPIRLTFVKSGILFGQAWSPDGKKVAYVSDVTGRQEIYVYDWDTKKSVQLTYSTGYADDGTGWWWSQFPSWSPDGKQIVYSSDRGHDATFSEIWVMDANGANAHKLGNGVWDAYNPVWIKWTQ
jgi:hypothetical protein